MVKNDESTNLYVARQAILNKDKQTVAYELLFRDSFENQIPVLVNKYVATKKLLVNSMAVFGLDKLTGNKPAFINFTDKNIENGQVELLPPDKVYIEILEDVKISRTLLSTCKRLRNKGYKFALDDFVFTPDHWPLIKLASVVKIDFSITKTADARKSIRKTIPDNISLLAEKVETKKDYEQAANLGYDFFQGYFFCKPTIISKRTTVTNALSQILLLQEINRSMLNINELENIIKQDISLVHKLLKYINSPFIGLSYKISSIKQAIILLGKDKIRKWINIICLQELSQKYPNELFAILLVRGKLCELIAANIKIISGEKDTAFLVGILSLSDVLFGQPMEEIITELGVTEDIRAALLGKNNIFGSLLQIAKLYETANWQNIHSWCKFNNFSEKFLAELYSEAVIWSNSINKNIKISRI